MPSAHDVDGVVFKNGSATFLARIVGADGEAIKQADLSAAEYTVYLVNPGDENGDVAVDGHEGESLVIASTIFDTLQTDDLWDVDTTGYNFKHVLDVSSDQAFALAGRKYRVVFTLTPVAGQDILVRFLVKAI